MFKKDNLQLGIIMGLVAPVIAMFVYYLVTLARLINFQEYIYYLKTNKSLLTGVSSVSLIANAILFTIYINSKRDKTAKGIFVSTLVYGIAVLLIKLIR
jgi:hypothetical protein